MHARAWSLVLGLLLGCTALTEERTNVADGLACERSDECRSKQCQDGFCAGRSCSTSDPSSCEPGWRCTELDGALLSAGSVECVALCGACPGNRHCPVGGETGVTPCEDGRPRQVTIHGPNRVKVNAEVSFSVTVDPPFPNITFVEWMVGEKAGQGQTFGGNGSKVAARLAINVETDLVVTAVVHGNMGDNRFETAEGMLAIHNECLGANEVCDADGEGYDHAQYCCGTGLYCPGQTGSKAPQYCVSSNR